MIFKKDSQFVTYENGKQYMVFMVDYKYEDTWWSFDIWATDWADADRRMQAIKNTGHVQGEIYIRREINPDNN
jgi:hypothetical protein